MAHLRSARVGLLAGSLAAAAGLFAGVGTVSATASHASASAAPAGHIYTESNALSGNSVVEFDRAANGKLTQISIVPTGGRGATQNVGCGTGCPILDTSGEVTLSGNGKWLLAVNAGSNTISSFSVTSTGVHLASQAPSGGKQPESVTIHGNLVYALNDNSATISGLKINTSTGKLTPIKGSTQKLASGPMGAGREISFDNNGKVLVVTEVGTSLINTFVMQGQVPGKVRKFKSAKMFPFGFAFTPSNQLVVSELTSMTGTGSTSTYKLTGSGTVSHLNTKPTSNVLPCWVAVTKDGKYTFVVNTGAGHPAPITRYSLASNGTLTVLGQTPSKKGEFARTDEVLSSDGKYLYVLVPSVKAGNTSHIDEYAVKGGNLTYLGATAANLAVGASGLAGR